MNTRRLVFVGSRTTRERNARGEGISVYAFDELTDTLSLIAVERYLVNPSYLALNRTGDRLYCVHGDRDYASAFRVDRHTASLTLLNQQKTGGRNPVHLALDPSERFLIVSNHLSQNVVALPVQPDGSLAKVAQVVELEGEPGPHRVEQPFSKPHFNGFDPTGRWVVVPDKGLDRIFIFEFFEGRLRAAQTPSVATREGAGPRHVAFHPNQPWVYCVNELDSAVAAYRFTTATGELNPFQVTSALSDEFIGNSRAAGIAVHPNGQALYTSNRGEDSIAVFAIEPTSGRLTLAQTISSGGKTPRFFALSPNGERLFVLNEESDTLALFSVEPSGQLVDRGTRVACASPVCLVFGPT